MKYMRDEFTDKVKQKLAKRVGHRCSNPTCHQATSGPSLSTTESVNMGVAAHITAAAPRGARYDPSLTREQRKSYDNGIWLCKYCGDLVDKDAETYPVNLLRTWKTTAENDAAIELHRLPQGVQDQISTSEQQENRPRTRAPGDESLNDGEKIRTEFHESVRSNQFRNLDPSAGVLAIAIIPMRRPKTAIDLYATERLLKDKLKPISASGYDYQRDSRFFGTVAMYHNGKVFDVTEFTDRGIIRAANRRVLDEDSGDYRRQRHGEPIRSIYLSKIELVSVKAITSYFKLLEELKNSPPWYVDISLVNLRPSILLATDIRVHHSGEKVFEDKDIIPDLILIEEVLSEPNEIARFLRPAFNFLWRAFGFPGSPYYSASGGWR
jgi:hypothetical protein